MSIQWGLLRPIVLAISLPEHVLVKASFGERGGHVDIQDAGGRIFATLRAVEEAHLLVENQVRVAHGVIGLWHQHPRATVPLNKGFKLLAADYKLIDIALGSGSGVLAVNREYLEALPATRLECLDDVAHVLLPI